MNGRNEKRTTRQTRRETHHEKTITLLLTLCLLLGLLPVEAAAYLGDIRPVNSDTVTTKTLSSGSLELRNDYLRVIVRKDGTLSTAPAADSADPTDRQMPYCNFVTFKGSGYNKRDIVHPAELRLKHIVPVDKTPNGAAKAIKVEYDLTATVSGKTVTGTTTVYYEIVKLSSEGAWGVLTSVDNIKITSVDTYGALGIEFEMRWGYTLSGFAAMGHRNAADSPALKLSRTVYDHTTGKVLSTENSVLTSKVENLYTAQDYPPGGDWCSNYITEVYTDGYNWANPFVGLSQYYKNGTIKAYLPKWVSVTPASRPGDTRVECGNDVGFYFGNENGNANSLRFLWGFCSLTKLTQPIPSEPDKINPAIYAKRLGVFAVNGGVTVEYVADDAALSALKRQYKKDPVALINGDYKSTDGTSFEFTGGAALLSPSVTATWGSGGRLVIHKNGTVEQNGVSLSAPTFKFYQPKTGEGSALGISLTKKGFEFAIEPAKNDAIVYVDIPYATVKLEKATADAAGNLVFSGNIGFQTIFDGAEFSLEKLGYGLKGNEFKVNGVHAKGSFDTEKMLSLELAKVKGEVNTFNGNKRYAFELELNVFDLFETKAELELTRSKKDGSLLPNTLYFYVKASPGIPLIPPIPVGQLNGGGAGFMDLAKTVNGDYFAIPPIKLRGTLTGTYLHLIEGTGDVVIGPSEISLTASDVGIVGAKLSIIDSFGYALKLNGQERTYNGTPYTGVYLVGSEALELNLLSTKLDVIVLKSSIELGAFGGVNEDQNRLYLGIGANGKVQGILQIPSNFFIPCLRGAKLSQTDIQLIIGGQTTARISGVSVSEGMKDAFNNINVYLGAMAQTTNWLYDVRAWVILPNIIKTDFEKGKGWDLEGKLIKKLPEWKWEDHGVTPVVQAVSLEDGEEFAVMLAADPLDAEPRGGGNSKEITVKAVGEETPYILLAFDESVSEEDIKQALIVTKKDETNRIDINWVGEDGQINSTYEINAGTDLIENVDGNKYRVVLLRLKSGGTYEVNTDSLTLVREKSKGVTVTPFEKLDLSLHSGEVTGQVEYAEMNTEYTLRTYLAEKEGGADYLIDEQIDVNPNSISVDIPDRGTHAPSGEYYVTSFLMTEKTTTVADENGESENVTALMAINSQTLETVLYTNTQQPNAPTDVTLTFVGNEVMRAAWDKVDDADGYRVTVYQKDGNEWKDTGFGYDLDAKTTSIDMALTVGGEETENSKNLSPNETYKIGVSAYREVPYFAENPETGSTESTETGSTEGEETSAAEGAEGSTAGSGGTGTQKALTAKYYSEETQSADDGVFLPEYKELKISLKVGDKECDKDNGVFHAYVGENPGTLTVICDDPDADFTVTRMDDTDYPVQLGINREWGIPTFEGSLMLKIDGKKDKDVTSEFLLVSRDETPPVLTLADPVFFADRDTGEYTITGTADAGSEILYGENGRTQAAGDGSFAIHDKLEDERETNASLYLRAKDSAGNESAQQLALITRQTRYAVTVNGSYADVSGAGSYAAGSVVTVRAGSRGGYTFNGWTADSSVAFDDANAAETTFTMPDGSVTVTANWSRDGGSPSSGRDDSDPRYAVGIPDKTENGSVSVSPKNASQGDRVTVTVKPDAGYELDSLKVFDKNGKELELTDKGDGRFTFIMPAGRVEVKAAFTEEVKISPFRDVPTDAYYYEAVKWAQKKGITGGIGNDLFGPYQPCTRAQIVTFLWRAAGSPVVNYAMDLTDVPGDAYYAEAVRWALSQGITIGTADGKFSPNAPCTRAQSVTFLFRASKASADGAPAFSDVAADAYYAEAVKWATDNGITNGTTSSTFSPAGGCTRAQIVTFLWRLYAEK